MGPRRCHGVVRVVSLCNFGGTRNHSPSENAAHPAARDILQSFVAYDRGVSTLVNEQVGGFTCGRYDFGILVGAITHRCGTVGVCVCKLHLQTQK